MSADLSLDVDSPEKVAAVLRKTAEKYHESASELAAAWTDAGAGRVWTLIARELERTALRVERIVEKE